MQHLEIVSLGQLVADIVLKPISSLPQPGSAEQIDLIQLKCGGCALNTGVVLKKLGVKAGVSGQLGNDVFGGFVLNSLKKTGLDIACVNISDTVPTSAAVVMILNNGERSFYVCPGGNEHLALSDVKLNLLQHTKILHIGGIMKLFKLDTAELLKWAKSNGITTSMDTDWDTTGQWISRIQGCLPFTDILMTSIEEANRLSFCQTPLEMGKFFLDRGVGLFVLKMGEHGCYIANGKTHLTIPAFDVNVIDTTGAGDAFSAGFLTGWLKKWDISAIGQFANACGALCTTQIGTTEGIDSFDSVLSFSTSAKPIHPVNG